MAFFDMMNAGAAPSAKYMKISDITLYVPMVIENMEFAATVIGATTKINAVLGSYKIFFYLNYAGYLKSVENDAPASVMALMNLHQAPFCFVIKGGTSLGVRYIPYDVKLIHVAQRKGLLKLSQIPELVRNEINLQAHAQIGIVFEP